MPIPSFTIDGVLPPFIGADGPGGRSSDMSPYHATSMEVVSVLGGTDRRRDILRGWLKYRDSLRNIGFIHGFQWLDGSFVEEKMPNDLDIVTFLHHPLEVSNIQDVQRLVQENFHLFDRKHIKGTYNLDAFFVDLNGPAESIVNLTRYYLGLFSHRRVDNLWKGMLQVRLEDVDSDAKAYAVLHTDTDVPKAAEGEKL